MCLPLLLGEVIELIQPSLSLLGLLSHLGWLSSVLGAALGVQAQGWMLLCSDLHVAAVQEAAPMNAQGFWSAAHKEAQTIRK